MFDYHVHTSFSADSEMPMLEACQQALAAGLQEIAFTDHIDYFYPGSEFTWQFDYNRYAQTIENMRRQFGSKLRVVKGVEVGLHPQAYAASRTFTGANEFDFIIGSVHIVGGQDLHNGEYFQGKSVAEAVTTYFAAVNSCVKAYREFNVLGHLDLVKRYLYHLGCAPETVNWQQYDEYLIDTLQHLAQTGRGIEINMSGYNYGLNCPLPDLRALRLYREAGGEIVTIGSDAHTTARIGGQADLGRQMLATAGFKYITTFSGQKPKFIPLSEIR